MKEIRRKLIKSILYILFTIVYRTKIIGKENIPASGKYLLCGNHIHALDAVAVVVTAKRQIRFVAKEELFSNIILRHLAKIFDIIKIKRDSADMEAIKEVLKGIKNGDIIGIYPEGTRNGMEKHKDFKTGAAYIALKTNTEVIPVGIKGTFKPFSKIILNYGKPMNFSKYAESKNDKKIQEKVTNEIMKEVVKLAREY